VERVVHVTFDIHVPLDSVASMVTGFSPCGTVRATDETRRCYVITVRRPSAMAHLQRRLAQWEKYGFLSWRVAGPNQRLARP
jgi:hypothetical protein